jgi:endonuclease/exonuclease/phosphatase family metal-dependent hydrolase
VATFNTYSLGGTGVQFTKVISAIHQMNGPTFLALQEVRTPALITGLLSSLAGLGYEYDFAFSHPDYGGHGVILLWRIGKVLEAHSSTAYQACSPNGSPTSTFDPLWDTCRGRGEYPLFARRPVVVTATLQLEGGHLRVVAIANHFKSRVEGESAEVRRLEEARFVAGLASELGSRGARPLIVLGDLNDFEDSLPLQALYAGGILTSTCFSVPQENRYSYIFQGVSQGVDHILVTPGLARWLEAASPLHFNADFPYQPYARQRSNPWRSSDHDPVAATFTVRLENILFLPQVQGK